MRRTPCRCDAVPYNSINRDLRVCFIGKKYDNVYFVEKGYKIFTKIFSRPLDKVLKSMYDCFSTREHGVLKGGGSWSCLNESKEF